APPTALSQQVDDWINQGQVTEAKEFIADGHQTALSGLVGKWYDAGCPKVWFLVERDMNGHGAAMELVLELPQDKTKRAAVYQIIKDYYTNSHLSTGPDSLKDTGERYAEVRMNH